MNPYECVLHHDIDEVLSSMIRYAETQAKLYQSHNEPENFNYWVKAWWLLQKAQDGIGSPGTSQAALSAWKSYQNLCAEL